MPADAALVAVVLLLREVVVEEVALKAGVSPKPDSARCAVPSHRLPCAAQAADDLLHGLAVQRVPLLRVLLIVALDSIVAVTAAAGMEGEQRPPLGEPGERKQASPEVAHQKASLQQGATNWHRRR